MERIMNKLVRFVKDESGATAIEYGLIAAAIGLMLVVAMPLLATALSGIFGRITSALSNS
jgi:pilus assembly protein Flp/PilA